MIKHYTLRHEHLFAVYSNGGFFGKQTGCWLLIKHVHSVSVLHANDFAIGILVHPVTVVGYICVDSRMRGLCAAQAPAHNTLKQYTSLVGVRGEVTDDWSTAVTLFIDRRHIVL